MAFGDWGNPPINSTQGEETNPTSTALLAELTPAQLGTADFRISQSGLYGVNAMVGASTLATFLCERCLSTGLGSTAVRETTIIYGTVNQTGEYLQKFRLEKDDRLRIRLSAGITGVAAAKLSVERLT